VHLFSLLHFHAGFHFDKAPINYIILYFGWKVLDEPSFLLFNSIVS